MKKTWNRLFVNFLNGIVILLPVTVTIVILRFCVIKVNEIILRPLAQTLAPMAFEHQRVFLAKTIIFIGVIIMVAFIGWGAKVLMINRVFGLGEKILIKVPFIGKIYSTIKQILNSLLGQGKTIFKQVVLVEYPRKGLFTLGFTTGTTKGELKQELGQSGVNVFVPTTPNPTSGFFLVVPKDNLHFLKMSVEDGMKMVISGGSITPLSPWIQEEPEED